MATEKERVREKEIVVWFSSGFVIYADSQLA